MRGRCAAASFSLLWPILACASPPPADEPASIAQESDFAQEAARRVALIQAELEAMEECEHREGWAGRYNAARPEGISLWVAPEGGFVYRRTAHRGREVEYNFGDVVYEGGYLKLVPASKGAQEVEGYSIALKLALVRWGERRQLVPRERTIDYCNSVNAGFARDWAAWSYLLRRMPEGLETGPGLPEVPEEWRAYVLEEPLDGRLIEVQTERHEQRRWAELDVEITVDIGTADGLLKGMQLRFDRGERGSDLVFRVIDVEEERATAVLRDRLRLVPPELRTGAVVSTRRGSAR